MSTPIGVYPFATQDGKAIPLDIIKAKSVIMQSFIAGAGTAITIPATATVGVLISDKACLLRFGTTLPASLIANTEYADTVLVPSGSIVVVAMTPGTAYVRGLSEAGTIYIQLIEKWAGLALNTQYQRK